MARTELPNGVILPAEYSDDWYEDMTSNLTKLDDVIGSDSEKLNADGVSFLRMSSAALTDGGTGNFSDLNSSYKIKTGDLVLDSGRKLYQVVSVDSTNERFTVGNSLFKITAESDLAPVAESGDYDDLDNKPDLKPVATSGDYDDLTDLPTYGITRYCSSAITDNSSVAFSAISSTDKIKVGDFLLDINGKIYQISSVDTSSETVSVTVPLTQLAVDSSVMHLSGNETAAGNKNFEGLLTTQPNGTLWPINTRTTDDITLLGDNAVHVEQRNSGNLTDLSNGAWNIANLGIGCFFFRNNSGTDIRYKNLAQNTVNRIYIVSNANRQLNNVTPETDNTYGLGDSTRRWKTINGISPSALVLPDLSNGIDISGYITAGNSHNEYTPLVDGWISVILKSTSSATIALFIYQGDVGNGHYGNTSLPNDSVPCVMSSIPVKAGTVVNIDTKGSNSYAYSAKFYPNLGNV